MSGVVETLSGFSPVHGYLILFIGVMLENAGVPLPGETMLLAGGYLSSTAGGGHLKLGFVILSAFAGAVVGDNLGYWAGRLFARKRLERGQRFFFLTPDRLAKAEEYFAKYGILTVFFGRFIALLRIVAGPAAGAAGMPWLRFLTANVAGGAVWASSVGVLGHAAGPAWQQIHNWLGRSAWVLAGLLILAFAVWHLIPYVKRKPAEST